MSLAVKPLAKEFNKSTTDITWGITLVLMLRSVGAITFGIASDRYGRKWPFVINNLLFIVLELVSRFSLLSIYPRTSISSVLVRTRWFGAGCQASLAARRQDAPIPAPPREQQPPPIKKTDNR